MAENRAAVSIHIQPTDDCLVGDVALVIVAHDLGDRVHAEARALGRLADPDLIRAVRKAAKAVAKHLKKLEAETGIGEVADGHRPPVAGDHLLDGELLH